MLNEKKPVAPSRQKKRYSEDKGRIVTEYFTIEIIATLILPFIATIGFVHSKSRLARNPAMRQLTRPIR